MSKTFIAGAKNFFAYFWPFLLVCVLVKITQAIFYPDPYMISDTGEYLNSARTLTVNPYKPIGYSLFLALSRVVLPFPLGVLILHGVAKILVTLLLGAVLKSYYGFPRWAVLTVCLVVVLNPTALLFDHYLLSDSLFTSCTVGLIGGLLAYIKRPNWGYLAVAVLFSLASVALRFVGLVYPALVLAVVILHGGKQRVLRSAVVLTATGATLLGFAAKMNHDLGVFKLTTFDGWAFHGTIGHLLIDNPVNLERIEDPETRLVCEYIQSFPLQQFRGRHRDFFRWQPESPAKHLLNTFLPMTSPPDEVTAARDAPFLMQFTAMADDPQTPAQKMFQKFRNKTNPKYPPYVMDYRPAFILTNELLRAANKEFMRQNRRAYFTGFYVTSLRKLFIPNEPPIVKGKYPMRQEPDYSVDQFWPGEMSSGWRPRFGDVAGALNWTHQWFVTGMWLVALHAFALSMTRRRERAVAWFGYVTSPGVMLLLFAAVSGAMVAYSHMMEVRYTGPIMTFVIVSVALLYEGSRSPGGARRSKVSKRSGHS